MPAVKTKPAPDITLKQLDSELLEALDKARGDTPREEWVQATLEERIAREKLESEPIADLDEEPKRATIRHQGSLYELRHIQEFGPVEQHGLNRDGGEFSRIWSSQDELDQAQGDRLTMLIDRLFEKIIVADAETRATFTPAKKARVILAFTYAPAKQLAQLAALLQTVTQPGSESA